MITLYTFGPHFGLPDPSPFVTKAEMLLKMAGLPYRIDTSGFRKAPKGKLPYIDDDGEQIAGFDLHPLAPREEARDRFRSRAQRRAARHRLGVREDGRGPSVLGDASMRAGSTTPISTKGPRKFFERVPAPVRPLVVADDPPPGAQDPARPGHGPPLAAPRSWRSRTRSIDAIADYLGQKPYFMGARADRRRCHHVRVRRRRRCARLFETPMRTAAERHDNLKRYVGRMTARFYPDFERNRRLQGGGMSGPLPREDVCRSQWVISAHSPRRRA